MMDFIVFTWCFITCISNNQPLLRDVWKPINNKISRDIHGILWCFFFTLWSIYLTCSWRICNSNSMASRFSDSNAERCDKVECRSKTSSFRRQGVISCGGHAQYAHKKNQDSSGVLVWSLLTLWSPASSPASPWGVEKSRRGIFWACEGWASKRTKFTRSCWGETALHWLVRLLYRLAWSLAWEMIQNIITDYFIKYFKAFPGTFFRNSL